MIRKSIITVYLLAFVLFCSQPLLSAPPKKRGCALDLEKGTVLALVVLTTIYQINTLRNSLHPHPIHPPQPPYFTPSHQNFSNQPLLQRNTTARLIGNHRQSHITRTHVKTLR